MRRFFITATGTDVGKTLVTSALCWQLQNKHKNIVALKPIISGYDANDPKSDTAIILKSLGMNVPHEAISPWRFAAPLSPDMAAAREGKSLVLEEIVDFCRKASGDVVLVEGVGGVMVPLNDRHTVLDWMAELNWPVILVCGSYLGALSHTLCALEVLKMRGLRLQALVVSESENSSVDVDDTIATLKKFLPPTLPVVKIPRLGGQELWKQVPPIDWICDE